ncbi:MAG: hypothetical protein WAV76_05260 [Bacteroidota bacterium]
MVNFHYIRRGKKRYHVLVNQAAVLNQIMMADHNGKRTIKYGQPA